MGVWLVMLALGTSFLMQKNQRQLMALEHVRRQVNSAADPADPGPETREIRNVQRSLPLSETVGELNMQDLSRKDVATIQGAHAAAAQEVTQYEAPVLPEIEGVYLQFDNFGI